MLDISTWKLYICVVPFWWSLEHICEVWFIIWLLHDLCSEHLLQFWHVTIYLTPKCVSVTCKFTACAIVSNCELIKGLTQRGSLSSEERRHPKRKVDPESRCKYSTINRAHEEEDCIYFIMLFFFFSLKHAPTYYLLLAMNQLYVLAFDLSINCWVLFLPKN